MVEEAEGEAKWIEDPSEDSPDEACSSGDNGPDGTQEPADESGQLYKQDEVTKNRGPELYKAYDDS